MLKGLLLATLVVAFVFPAIASAQDETISGEPCNPEASPEWEELVEDTDALLERSQLEFSSGALVMSAANESTLRQFALDWIDMNGEWRDVEIPDGREIIQFTANRLAGHMSSTFTYMIDGSIDEFQLGKTAEAIDAYVVSNVVYELLQLGC